MDGSRHNDNAVFTLSITSAHILVEKWWRSIFWETGPEARGRWLISCPEISDLFRFAAAAAFRLWQVGWTCLAADTRRVAKLNWRDRQSGTINNSILFLFWAKKQRRCYYDLVTQFKIRYWSHEELGVSNGFEKCTWNLVRYQQREVESYLCFFFSLFFTELQPNFPIGKMSTRGDNVDWKTKTTATTTEKTQFQ